MQLYELEGRKGLRYSLYSWRSRMALLHKGLIADFCPVLMHDKNAVAFSGGKTVPILVDGETVVRDSWKIAFYLDQTYPDQPLFGDDIGRGTTQVFCNWVDASLVPLLAAMIAVDIVTCIDPADVSHFRSQMEGFFRKGLEEAAREREHAAQQFAKQLDPVRRVLVRQSFICGELPAYADYALFSLFQWARLTSQLQLLAEDDAVAVWREAMLNLHQGAARHHAPMHMRAA